MSIAKTTSRSRDIDFKLKVSRDVESFEMSRELEMLRHIERYGKGGKRENSVESDYEQAGKGGRSCTAAPFRSGGSMSGVDWDLIPADVERTLKGKAFQFNKFVLHWQRFTCTFRLHTRLE
eukprot:g56334.t1